MISYMTGAPITILAGQDQSRTANNSDHANYLGGPVYGAGACGNTARCVNYLVKSSFGLPALGTFGSVGKGSVYGPNFFGWDAGLFKEFPLHAEKLKLQFRAEFFNLLNHADFNNPNNSVSSGGFGTITSAQDPRIGQLALKVLF